MSGIENLLWLTSFITSAGFLAALLFRGRSMPWLIALATSAVSLDVSLWFVSRFGSHELYFQVYWTMAAINAICQFGVVYEIARSALYLDGSWLPRARRRLFIFGGLSLLAALYAIPSVNTAGDSLFIRLNLFVSIWVYLLVFFTVVVARRHGATWQKQGLREGYGFLFWSGASFLIDTLHVMRGTSSSFDLLEDLRFAAFEIVTVFWIVYLLRTREASWPSL